MHRESRQAGFTLIEVMLFLAITGLLFLIGFFGTGNQIRSVRFTDSMRGLHSYLQKQYGLVTTGSNPRLPNKTCSSAGALGTPPTLGTGGTVPGDTAGDEDSCALLGRLVKFNPNSSTITSYYVVGRNVRSADLTGNDITDLANAGPTLSDEAQETYQINWGAVFHQPSTAASGNQTQAFAYLRSPNTGRILTFAFPNSAVNASTLPGDPGASDSFRAALTQANVAKNAGFCFKDQNSHNALLKLGYDQRTDALDLVLKSFDQNTDCVRSKS